MALTCCLLQPFCLVIFFMPLLRFAIWQRINILCARLDSIWRLSCRHFAIRHISFPLVVAYVCFLARFVVALAVAIAELNYLCMSRHFRLTNNNNNHENSHNNNNNNRAEYEKICAEIQMSLAKLRHFFLVSFFLPVLQLPLIHSSIY